MNWQEKAIELFTQGWSARSIATQLGMGRTKITEFLRDFKSAPQEDVVKSSPRILLIDIETAPLAASLWSMWQQGVSLNQIRSDWFILSYCAKWIGEDEVMYNDLRGVVAKEDDRVLCLELHELLCEADFIVAHNAVKFDDKKIKARMLLNGLSKPSPYRVIDTLHFAKEQFALTSNKLEYLSDKLSGGVKKSKHEKFPGYELWKNCLDDNIEAWEEMRSYNIDDVLALEEVYNILSAWSNKLPNFDVYTDDVVDMSVWEEDGYSYTNLGKYQVYRHKETGQYKRGRVNLLSKEKRQSLLANI